MAKTVRPGGRALPGGRHDENSPEPTTKPQQPAAAALTPEGLGPRSNNPNPKALNSLEKETQLEACYVIHRDPTEAERSEAWAERRCLAAREGEGV
jgi:hypothetical protein